MTVLIKQLTIPVGRTASEDKIPEAIAERYGLKLGIPAYVAAAYVGHTRVHDGRHDETDVVAGAVLGFVTARFFTDKFSNEKNQLTIVPAVGEGLVGLSISFRH